MITEKSESASGPLHPEFPILATDRPLEALALAINEEHALAEQYATMAIHRAHRAGDLMLAAKQRVAHGQWLPWLKANCPTIKDRTARAYMQLARNWATLESKTATVADLTINEALKLLAEPRPEPEPELGFEPEPLTAEEQAELKRHEKIILHSADDMESEISRIIDALHGAKHGWCAPHPGFFEAWCSVKLGLPDDLREMLLDPARRWHPRFWDDEQAALFMRWAIPLAGGSEEEAESCIQDRLEQLGEAAQ